MSGILWAALGTAIGVLGPFLFRAWQRRAATPGVPMPPEPRQKIPVRVAPTTAPGKSQPQLRQAPPARSPAGINRKQARKFHGVSVKPGPHACSASQALVGQRFLPQEAPAMPLAGCDQQRCQCSYGHHSDRRDQDDRRSGWGSFGGFAPSIPGGNRRGKKQDRRS